MPRYIDPFTKYTSKIGEPLPGGQLFFFESGSTTTPKDTFSDVDETPRRLTQTARRLTLTTSAKVSCPKSAIVRGYEVILWQKNSNAQSHM